MAKWLVEWESGKTEQVSVHTKDDGSHQVFREGKEKAERWPSDWPKAVVSASQVKTKMEWATEIAKPGKIYYVPSGINPIEYYGQQQNGLYNLAAMGGLPQAEFRDTYRDRMNAWHQATGPGHTMPE